MGVNACHDLVVGIRRSRLMRSGILPSAVRRTAGVPVAAARTRGASDREIGSAVP
ncbi:hypothetical protein [Streptomyces sp. LUP47B]|uniref:hypothetical protein n=1 Tax=Streptomyces sp. LUP47B TaxID=1890286 RepID=UPI00159F272E|nr:hypothetical protein [Streptomyces sp. LUP47B]